MLPNMIKNILIYLLYPICFPIVYCIMAMHMYFEQRKYFKEHPEELEMLKKNKRK